MKILFLIDNLGSGGAQRQLVNIVKLLNEDGFNITIVCYSTHDFFASMLKDSGIKVHWISVDSYFKRVWVIRKFIRRGQFDAVISFLEVPNFINCISSVGNNTWKTITTELSSNISTFKTARGKVFKWFQRFSDKIVCNSFNAEKMWATYYPSYSKKLATIYNPVILPEISSTYIPLKEGKLHIVVAASYQYLKNPIGLIKALTLLDMNVRSKLNVDWYGRIEVTTGDSRAYNEAVQLIKRFNLQEVINLYPATNDIIDRMVEADVVALFSQLEGLPNAICEGMKLGKPIIMSRVSDYSMLVDEMNGFLCDWDNAESIKDAITSALRLSEKQLIEMGIASRRKADHLFSPAAIVNQWIDEIKA